MYATCSRPIWRQAPRFMPAPASAWRCGAAERYVAEGRSVVLLAGERYGMGSSRDWAAKGAALLGIRAVLARGFERIHSSNLIGLGILPLSLPADRPSEELRPGFAASVDI